MSRYYDIDPMDLDPDTGRPYAGYSSDALDTSFHDGEMDVDGDEPEIDQEAARELLTALDDLLAFHDHKHPRHELLHDEYESDCLANEVAPSGSGLLDTLQQAARAAIARAGAA